jgi:3(or 17)beta-hydroxysteroid dehydrogenase
VVRVPGKIALVTGAASGLGAAIAKRLAEEGAVVTLTDIRAAEGRGVAESLKCQFMEHDVGSDASWNTVLTQVEKRYGGLHILVNNAGMEGSFTQSDPETTSVSDWRALQRVNVEGAFLGCRMAIPILRRAGGGSIINMSSTAGLAATPTYIAYGASKAAVRHLTMSVALHCARNGSRIRCNSVHPGIVLTPMVRRIAAELAAQRGLSVDAVLEELRSAIPQGEFQEPEDIAAAVAFLSSDEARHITGMTMIVDGGSMLGTA